MFDAAALAVVVAVVALLSVERLKRTYQTDDCPNCKSEQTVASIRCEPDMVPDAVALGRHILMYEDRRSTPRWGHVSVAN